MFLEAPAEMIHCVYVTDEFLGKSIHADKVKKLPHEIVAQKVFSAMSDTKAPQGILTILKIPKYNLSCLKDDRDNLLILNGIQDPGNLGTMVRTAEAAGVSGIIMDRQCADIFNPKVIRSTMGSIFRVPFVVSDNLADTVKELKQSGVKMVAAHLKGEELSLENRKKSERLGIMIGNEGAGLSEELSLLADYRVRIPMKGKVESLNAAISAALLMYLL